MGLDGDGQNRQKSHDLEVISFSNSSAISSSLTIPLRRRIRRIDSRASCVDGATCEARLLLRAPLDGTVATAEASRGASAPVHDGAPQTGRSREVFRNLPD